MVRCWKNFVESLNMDPHLNEMERFLAEASLEVFRGLRTLKLRQRHMNHMKCICSLQAIGFWGHPKVLELRVKFGLIASSAHISPPKVHRSPHQIHHIFMVCFERPYIQDITRTRPFRPGENGWATHAQILRQLSAPEESWFWKNILFSHDSKRIITAWLYGYCSPLRFGESVVSVSVIAITSALNVNLNCTYSWVRYHSSVVDTLRQRWPTKRQHIATKNGIC